MASMYSYNNDQFCSSARRQYNGREEQRKSAILPSVESLFTHTLLSKADENRSIPDVYVLDQLPTPRPRRLVSKYLERKSAWAIDQTQQHGRVIQLPPHCGNISRNQRQINRSCVTGLFSLHVSCVILMFPSARTDHFNATSTAHIRTMSPWRMILHSAVTRETSLGPACHTEYPPWICLPATAPQARSTDLAGGWNLYILTLLERWRCKLDVSTFLGSPRSFARVDENIPTYITKPIMLTGINSSILLTRNIGNDSPSHPPRFAHDFFLNLTGQTAFSLHQTSISSWGIKSRPLNA